MAEKNTAGVLAPPPLIVLAPMLAGFELDHLWPSPGLAKEIGYSLGVVLGVAGFGCAVPAMLGFRRAGTRAEPWHPTTALVTGGLYRRTRNPMYLGLVLFYLAVTAAFGGLWVLAMLVPAVAACITASSCARSAIWRASSAKPIGTTSRRCGGGYEETPALDAETIKGTSIKGT